MNPWASSCLCNYDDYDLTHFSAKPGPKVHFHSAVVIEVGYVCETNAKHLTSTACIIR